MRFVMFAVPLGFIVGCPAPQDSATSTEETGQDTASGGGQEDNWRASGAGFAYFSDGEADNSLFRLELSRALPPRDGEHYYGFVSSPTSGLVPVGEITLNGEDVDFSADIGENAVVAGFNHFEAWQSDGDGSTPDGDPVWEGNVDSTVFEVVQRLLIANPDTPTGEGSLRGLETQLEFLRDEASAASTGGLTLEELNLVGEKIGNGLEDPTVDANNDGDDDLYENNYAVEADDKKGDSGYVELITEDFTNAALALDPRDPIRGYIEVAIDGVQLCDYQVAHFAAPAARQAGSSSNEDIAKDDLATVAEDLQKYLDGFDADGDGTEEDFEIGIEDSIDLTSQMAQMTVDVAK